MMEKLHRSFTLRRVSASNLTSQTTQRLPRIPLRRAAPRYCSPPLQEELRHKLEVAYAGEESNIGKWGGDV